MNMIRERREELGLTQAELAAMLRDADPRMDVGMVSRLENDVCIPSVPVLAALERHLQAHKTELYPSLVLFVLPEENADTGEYAASIAALVPFGSENAISREALASALGMTDRDMRRAVSEARRDGVIIINDQSGRGYYRSDDVADLRRQLRQTHRRAMSLLVQEKHLNARIKALEMEGAV